MKLNRFTLSVVIASISMVSASSYALTSEEEATVLAGFESAVSTISSTEDVVNSAKPHKTPSAKGINRPNRGRGKPVSPS